VATINSPIVYPQERPWLVSPSSVMDFSVKLFALN
jgi:hypothetical protein